MPMPPLIVHAARSPHSKSGETWRADVCSAGTLRHASSVLSPDEGLAASSLARLGIARRVLEIRDQIGPLMGVFNAGIGHLGARNSHHGILEKVIECLLVPDHSVVLHRC